ncbi:MAG: TldD/PmbA family protein, partial [Deltaproteobacteria bacterium]|nr:TldD/PmbA family protein [Candidatus Anaeroferrophillacea bacterium]
MEKILALAMKSVQAAEVFEVSSEETRVRFESNRLKQLQTNQSTSVALRVIKDGRLGYATATGEGNAEELVRNAVETAEFGMKAEFIFPDATSFPAIDIDDPAVMQVPLPDMVRLGEEMIAAVTGHTKDIMCDSGITRGAMTMKIMNSSGGRADYRKTFFGIDIEGTVIEGTDMLFV